jgi:hypothetical protein
MKNRWKCDIRVGCIAIYKGKEQDCLYDANKRAKHYFHGKYTPERGWEIKRRDVFIAKLITFWYNLISKE